jgi:hypothetical protein
LAGKKPAAPIETNTSLPGNLPQSDYNMQQEEGNTITQLFSRSKLQMSSDVSPYYKFYLYGASICLPWHSRVQGRGTGTPHLAL